MDDIFLRYVSLPPAVHGMTVQDEEGNYNIYLNSRHTYEANVNTFQHEIQHIQNDDFNRQAHIKDIEK